MNAPRIERTTFATSRLLDFVSQKELVLQCGYGPRDWPLVILKELLDNALDATEEQGIAPEIVVTVDASSITVADNGAGIPPETVDRLLDFSIRVSSREAYVAPDRGAQGNALKTIVAMPFVMDGEQGRIDICGGGVLSEIRFSVDRIRQQPKADLTRSPAAGSYVRVHWPQNAPGKNHHDYFDMRIDGEWDDSRASSLLDDAERFLQVADDFTFLNPHLTLAINWFGEETITVATDRWWEKWTPASPTCPHWYRLEEFERLVAAYLISDIDSDRYRPVREFVCEFRGLTSTIKQKAVLAELELARVPLSALTRDGDFDHEKTGRLLEAMQAQSKPVKPRLLGVIGRDHIEQRFGRLGIIAESFTYSKTAAFTDEGLPQVTEVAFAALEDADAERRLVTGVNWSAAWVNPFRQLGGYGRSLDTKLTEMRAGSGEPIVVLVHVAHPRVQYADRGKSTVVTRG